MGVLIITADDRSWQAAMDRYVMLNKRELPEILNAKGLFVALKAYQLTPKTLKATVKSELGEYVKVESLITKGKRAGSVKSTNRMAWHKQNANGVPVAAMIINSRRGKAGKKGLWGKKMENAVIRMIGARVRSTAFMALGWMPAIKAFGKKTKYKRDAPQIDKSLVTPHGKDKGGAFTASEGKLQATIINSADPTHDKKRSLFTKGDRALREALQIEEASMWKYIKDKLQPAVDEFNKKTP